MVPLIISGLRFMFSIYDGDRGVLDEGVDIMQGLVGVYEPV